MAGRYMSGSSHLQLFQLVSGAVVSHIGGPKNRGGACPLGEAAAGGHGCLWEKSKGVAIRICLE